MKTPSRTSVILLAISLSLYSVYCSKRPESPVFTVEFSTGSPIETSLDGAVISATISSNLPGEINEQGVCWSEERSPTISDRKLVLGSGGGRVMAELSGLLPGTQYYARVYAKTSSLVKYSEELGFKTLSLATVSNPVMQTIAKDAVTITGEITTDGGATITERGVCWDVQKNPTVERNKVSAGSGTGLFTITVSGLSATTLYYFRIYAISNAGVSYSNELPLTTLGLPVLTTAEPGSITDGSAKVSAEVTSDGGAAITERGFCWSKLPVPTIENSKILVGTGAGIFNAEVLGLEANTVYYLRAFAVNSVGITYGNERNFKTKIGTPRLTTLKPYNILVSSATSGGTIVSDGNAQILERGLCWSTNPEPTINDYFAKAGAGTGSFTLQITGLADKTQYYVRAYAWNGTYGYGDRYVFTTPPNPLPTVVIKSVSVISVYTGKGTAEVVDEGLSPVTSRGFCYTSYYRDPTTADAKTITGAGTGVFTDTFFVLDDAWYTVRAYATNSYGTAYSNSGGLLVPARPPDPPRVTTPANGAEIHCCEVRFSWQTTPPAVMYSIELSTNADFSGPKNDLSPGMPNGERLIVGAVNSLMTSVQGTIIKMDNPALNGKWYWRIRSYANGMVAGPWASGSYFIFSY